MLLAPLDRPGGFSVMHMKAAPGEKFAPDPPRDGILHTIIHTPFFSTSRVTNKSISGATPLSGLATTCYAYAGTDGLDQNWNTNGHRTDDTACR